MRGGKAAEREDASRPVEPVAAAAVTKQYERLAFEMYADSLRGARVLQREIEALVASPSADTHAAAKRAWIDARRRYSQTEALRFGNPNVDEWEGGVNAWPMDEGFLDYVAQDYEHDLGNPHAARNLIASDAALDPGSLRSSHEMSGLEPNVATGFHAIEFLLWGQDIGTPPSAAGARSYTDYVVGEGCTHGSCERRGRYLRLAANLLVFDLRKMEIDWRGERGDGYASVYASLPETEQLRRIVVGLGTMSAGELAGERLSVALLASSQEDEQSCFSDTTHLDVYYNALGVENVYLGRYVRSDGTRVAGPSLSDLIAARAPALDTKLRAQLAASVAAAGTLVELAEAGTPFDRMIDADNAPGRAGISKLIELLTAQGESFDAVQAMIERGELAHAVPAVGAGSGA